jgi:hypothetical protein
MNGAYFQSSPALTAGKTAKFVETCHSAAPSVERFGYIARLIAGDDDEFLRTSGATLSQMAAHRRFRYAIYRRSLSCFRRDYRRLEAQALAGMQEHNVSIDEILTSRWKMKFEMAKLEFAGVLYLSGIPAGNQVLQALRSIENSLRIPGAVPMSV